MQALGFIETKGLIAATESADAMLKAASVVLLEKQYVGGGLVYISVTGDVGAVKAAVEAGRAAVNKIDETLLVSYHVIPRPNDELNCVILTEKAEPKEKAEINEKASTQEEKQPDEKDIIQKTESKINIEEIKEESLDKAVLEFGIEKTIEILNGFKVIRLRNLARQYKKFGITGRAISKADKKMLIEEFKKYYENNN